MIPDVHQAAGERPTAATSRADRDADLMLEDLADTLELGERLTVVDDHGRRRPCATLRLP